MPDEINNPPCPVHGAFPRALHEEGFQGAVEVLEELLATVSGVGTISYTRCPYGYEANWNGIVRALEDLNSSISGIQTGGVGISGVAPGSGIYFTPSGSYTLINADAQRIPGAIVSGVAPSGAPAGTIWFDENEGRTFVYVSGASNPGWYQLNAEALAYTSETPPSGTGDNAPPRDGLLWFNRDLGNLLVYDATSSGWYESDARRSVSYRTIAPSAAVPGEAYFDPALQVIRVWNGSEWVGNGSINLPSVTTSSTAAVILNSYSANSPGTRTYTINVERGGEVQTSDIKFINTPTDAYTSEFAVVYSSGRLAAFSGFVNGSSVELLAYSNTADQTIFRPSRITP